MIPFHSTDNVTIYNAPALEVLAELFVMFCQRAGFLDNERMRKT